MADDDDDDIAASTPIEEMGADIVVSPEDFAKILDMIQRPPEPTPALIELFRRHRALASK